MAEIDLLIAEGKQKLLDFEDLLLTPENISQKELNNRELSEKEYMVIWNIGVLLQRLCEFSPQIKEKITSGVDERMAIVLDVHTDPNSKEALEVGIEILFLFMLLLKWRVRQT